MNSQKKGENGEVSELQRFLLLATLKTYTIQHLQQGSNPSVLMLASAPRD